MSVIARWLVVRCREAHVTASPGSDFACPPSREGPFWSSNWANQRGCALHPLRERGEADERDKIGQAQGQAVRRVGACRRGR
jgi:hypothetical protein